MNVIREVTYKATDGDMELLLDEDGNISMWERAPIRKAGSIPAEFIPLVENFLGWVKQEKEAGRYVR